jgi:hypothetical protein
MNRSPAIRLFFLFNTAYLVIIKNTAAAAPAIMGEIPHEAKIWPTPLHPQFTPLAPRLAKPNPTIAPTIECVDDVGRPILFEIANHVSSSALDTAER